MLITQNSGPYVDTFPIKHSLFQRSNRANSQKPKVNGLSELFQSKLKFDKTGGTNSSYENSYGKEGTLPPNQNLVKKANESEMSENADEGQEDTIKAGESLLERMEQLVMDEDSMIDFKSTFMQIHSKRAEFNKRVAMEEPTAEMC